MPLRPSHLGILAATALLLPAPTRAADLDDSFSYAEAPEPVPVAQTKVEFGTGWYVRGDVGVRRLPSLDLTAPPDGSSPPTRLTSGSNIGYTASLGAGYSFNNWFRADVVADFRQPIGVKQFGESYPASSSNGYINNNGRCQLGYAGYTSVDVPQFYQPYYENCTSNYEASVRSFDVLVNGYLDLGHWSIVTPYVGAGVGLSFGHYNSSVSYYNPDGSPYNTYFAVPGDGITLHGYRDARISGNYYNPAFALMAGIAIDVLPHTKLDLGYRFVYLGKILGTTLTTNEARAGLRYMIDN